MRTVSIKLKDMAIANIQLGFVGENNATQVIFESKEIFDENPYAVQLLVVTPPEGTSYEVTTARIGDNVIWNVSELDTAFEGAGSIQLVFTDGSQVIKTYNADTTVLESHVPSGTAPATALNWIQDAEAWAKGTRGGRAVEDDDPTYQNNSKYYSQQIVDMASDSEAYAKGTRNGEAVESDDPAYHNNSKYYAESIADTASDSEAYAAGTRGGEDVDEDDPAYENNAKYYNEQAALEKAAAQAAAETASAAYNVNLLAANYDATKTYAVGEYVIYNGGLYRCISAITTAEAWTAAHWSSVTVGKDTSALKSAFEDTTGVIPVTGWNTGKRIATDTDPVTFALVTRSDHDCIVVDCSEGDVFTLTGKATNANYRLYCFTKTDGTIVKKPSSNLDWTEHKLETPANATKLIVNTLNTVDYKLYRGFMLDDEIKAIETDVNFLFQYYLTLSQTKAEEIVATQESPKDLNDYTSPGNYKVTTSTVASNISHIPYNIGGRLIVMNLSSSGSVVQVYITSAETKTNVYLRNYYSSAWTEWRNINPAYDTAPVQNSEKPITSGAVYDAITAEDGKIDELSRNVYKVEDYDWIAHAKASYPYGWRTGYYDGSDGSIESSNQYIRANPFIVCDPETVKMIAVAPTGYAIAIYEYTGNNEYIQKYGNQNTSGENPTSRVEVNTTPGYIYKISLGRFTNSDATDYINSTFVPTIKLYQYRTDSGEKVSNLTAYTAALGTAPSYRMPILAPAGETYVNDLAMTDGNKANITQGICSDGKRYLYWNIAPMGENLGREVNQRIRKWDTWRNESVGLSEPGDWGHCEDICFVPAWCPGFDNGSVDRLYATDYDYSVEHSTGRYVHVIDANTLEEIDSFQTSNIMPDEWGGVAHITFNQERGLFCLKGGTTVDGSDYWVFFVFDKSGTLLRGARVKKNGTGIGIDSDENYIYATRYYTNDGTTYIYSYAIDWELNPIARFEVAKVDWEIEGMTHLGADVYFSWNQTAGQSRKNTIEKTAMVYEMHKFTDTPPFNWASSDGIKLSTWESIDIET